MARKGYLTHTFTLPDGTRKYVYAKTKKELEEKVLKLKIELSYGVDLKDDTLLSDLVQLWFSTDVKGKVAPNTELNSKGILNNHLMPLIAGYKVKQVTPLQVKMWLNETGKLNKRSATTCFRALKEAFNIAEENGLIMRSPVLGRYKAGGKEPTMKRDALTPDEELRLIEVLQGTEQLLYVRFLLATGARRNEALALMWDCVDFDNAEVHLRRNLRYIGTKWELLDKLKTDSSTRVVPLPFDLCRKLKELKAQSTSLFVFPAADGGPKNLQSFSNFWNVVHRRFGPSVKENKKYPVYQSQKRVTPHVLRHTYATRCFEAGMDIKEVQYLLGHAKPDITLRIYTHYCLESRKDETFTKARDARSVTSVYHTCTTRSRKAK